MPDSTALHKIVPALQKLKRVLTKAEVQAVSNRLASLGTQRPADPEGDRPEPRAGAAAALDPLGVRARRAPASSRASRSCRPRWSASQISAGIARQSSSGAHERPPQARRAGSDRHDPHPEQQVPDAAVHEQQEQHLLAGEDRERGPGVRLPRPDREERDRQDPGDRPVDEQRGRGGARAGRSSADPTAGSPRRSPGQRGSARSAAESVTISSLGARRRRPVP